LGDHRHLVALALNGRFTAVAQLVGAFGRHKDESKLAIDARTYSILFSL